MEGGGGGLFLSSGPRIREQSQHDDSIQRLANPPNPLHTHTHAHHITITAADSGGSGFIFGNQTPFFLGSSASVIFSGRALPYSRSVCLLRSRGEFSRYFPGVYCLDGGAPGCTPRRLHLTIPSVPFGILFYHNRTESFSETMSPSTPCEDYTPCPRSREALSRFKSS